jgi:hypothetical protein
MNGHALLSRHRLRRSAAALVAVLILLTMVIGVAGGLVCLLALEQRQLRSHDDQLQSLWLVEAGLQKASAQLDQAPAYAGETWVVPAEALGGRRAGRVTIRVAPVENEPDRRTVSVTADYPDDPVHRHRTSRRIVVTQTPPGEAP